MRQRYEIFFKRGIKKSFFLKAMIKEPCSVIEISKNTGSKVESVFQRKF